MQAERVLGCSPDRLTPVERTALAGKWVALELYTPQTLPLRKIEAIGDSPTDCARRLTARGLDPNNFEYSMVSPPW